MSANQSSATSRRRVSHVVQMVVLILLLFFFIAPFLLVVVNVFKSMDDITSNPLSLIGKSGFTLENFPDAMEKMSFWTVLGNSTIITTSATVLTVLLSAMPRTSSSATRIGSSVPCSSP